MMADDEPVSMDLEKLSVRTMRERRRVTWTRATTCRTTMCVRSRGKDTKLAKEQARKDQTEQERGTEEKELTTGRVAKETMEERREARNAPRAANLIGTGDKNKGSNGNKEKGTGKGKNVIRCCCNFGQQRHIGVNCPYKWTNTMDEEDGQSSSWESDFDGDKPEEFACLEAPDDEA